MIWGGTQQKCPCSSGSSLGLDWGCHCARQLAPVHAHLLRDLIALHMECLLLTLSGMVKPSTIPSHAHVRLLQPGRGKKKKTSPARTRRQEEGKERGHGGHGRPFQAQQGGRRALSIFTRLSPAPPDLPTPAAVARPLPAPTLTCPGLSAISPFAFTARQPSPYPSSGHRPQLATVFFSPPPASSRSSRLPGLGFCRKKGTRNPTTAAAVESGTGRGKAGMRMKRGAE